MKLLEPRGLFVDRIDDYESSGSGLTGGHRLPECFGEYQPTKTLALLAPVHTEASEEGHADRVRRQATNELRGRIGSEHGAHRQAEVADDPTVTRQ